MLLGGPRHENVWEPLFRNMPARLYMACSFHTWTAFSALRQHVVVYVLMVDKWDQHSPRCFRTPPGQSAVQHYQPTKAVITGQVVEDIMENYGVWQKFSKVTHWENTHFCDLQLVQTGVINADWGLGLSFSTLLTLEVTSWPGVPAAQGLAGGPLAEAGATLSGSMLPKGPWLAIVFKQRGAKLPVQTTSPENLHPYSLSNTDPQPQIYFCSSYCDGKTLWFVLI